MSGLDVNITVAGAASQKFSQAASALNSVSAPAANVERTTISGQSNAQSTMQRMGTVGSQLSDALTRDGNNIHSVAEEFAAIDQQLGKGFDGLTILSGPGKG
ncbi:TIGR04197 family type VII secretion effector [Enterococcus sp. BWR-S5]|uniref:TIGR04197 family type VII secretion effector n=1 Tax=Enterococcus sp. BWR-S5 TaxID=2787714 RepID=UPI0019210BC3|nr:TIGR04197 family type VII secretion effector [Enterococcus sp. BWR-S5]MBL1225707.1 TIGR04197 family type VII secretion effector [Enterococcus sp. BWR-S5]